MPEPFCPSKSLEIENVLAGELRAALNSSQMEVARSDCGNATSIGFLIVRDGPAFRSGSKTEGREHFIEGLQAEIDSRVSILAATLRDMLPKGNLPTIAIRVDEGTDESHDVYWLRVSVVEIPGLALCWTLGDGTVVHLGGKVEGATELARELRHDSDLAQAGKPPHVLVLPPPGHFPLLVDDPWHVHCWVNAAARRHGVLVTGAPNVTAPSEWGVPYDPDAIY